MRKGEVGATFLQHHHLRVFGILAGTYCGAALGCCFDDTRINPSNTRVRRASHQKATVTYTSIEKRENIIQYNNYSSTYDIEYC